VADDQRDEDGDGLGDACDCAVPEERDAQRCWDEETKPELGGSPGLLTCPDGVAEPVCRSAWPDFATWIDEEILGPDFLEGPGAAEDLAAIEIDYIHDDGVQNCPPGVICEAGRAQQRGRDYEDWLCARELKKNGRTRCKRAPVGQRDTRYTTSGLRWTLPAQLGGHRMEQVIHRPAGRMRWADYVVPPTRSAHETTVLGEAKCYNPFIQYNANAAWSWYRAVGFGTQLWDYINKVISSRRAGGRHVVVYHFCDFIPRHVAYETTAALAATTAHGFTVRARDTHPGAQWITAPGCYLDMANTLMTVAPQLFECFVPGQIAPVGLDPADDCTGAFYDLCSGSE